MKRFVITLAALLLCLACFAGGKGRFLDRIHPGIDWGWSLTPAAYHHYNYLDKSIGFRINDEGWDTSPHVNAYILGSIAYDFSRIFGISILSGYQGIEKGRRIVPVVTRATFYLAGNEDDTVILFTDMGLALDEFKRKCNFFQLGSGYRIALNTRNSISFRMGLKVTYDRPDIWDPIEEEYIPEHNIKRNDAWYYALNLGLTMEF